MQQLTQNGGFLLLLARVAQCLPRHGMNWLLLPSFKRKAASEPLHELVVLLLLMLVVDAIILPAFCCIANSMDAFNYCRLNILKLDSTYTYLYL
jgi:hypothetical protein